MKVVQSSCESRCLRSSTSRPPSTSTLSVNFCDFPILVRSPRVTSSFTYRPGGGGAAEKTWGQAAPPSPPPTLCPVRFPPAPHHVPQRPARGWSWSYVWMAAAGSGVLWNSCPVGPSGPGGGKDRARLGALLRAGAGRDTADVGLSAKLQIQGSDQLEQRKWPGTGEWVRDQRSGVGVPSSGCLTGSPLALTALAPGSLVPAPQSVVGSAGRKNEARP